MSRLGAIDRLSLRVHGVEAADGRQVGELVARQLVLIDANVGAAAIDRLRIELSARPGESADALAGRIASAVSLAIARADAPEAGR